MAKDKDWWIWAMWANILSTKDKENSNEKGGCLSTIIGFIVLFFVVLCIIQEDFRASVFDFFGLILLVVGIIVAIVFVITTIGKKNLNELKKIQDEQNDLNNSVAECYELLAEGQYTKALEKAEPLANKHNDAANLAGLCYRYGSGCDINLEKAFKYFEQAHVSNPESLGMYADMLIRGEGCQADTQKGLDLLRKAANNEDMHSIMTLGEVEFFGDLVQQNVQEGMKNLRKAAEANQMYAQYLVGRILIEGTEGIPVNESSGWDFMNKSAQNGFEPAKEFIDEFGK